MGLSEVTAGKHTFHQGTSRHVMKCGAFGLPAGEFLQARRLNTHPESCWRIGISCLVWASSQRRGASSSKTITAGTH